MAIGGEEQQAECQVEPLADDARVHATQGIGHLRERQAGALRDQFAGHRAGLEGQSQHEAHAGADGQFACDVGDGAGIEGDPVRRARQQRRQRHRQRTGDDHAYAHRHGARPDQRRGHQQRTGTQHGPQDGVDHPEGLLAVDHHLVAGSMSESGEERREK